MQIARGIVDALEDKKAEDILLIDLQGVASFADYFIITTGTSDRMLNSLAKSVIEKAKTDYELRGTAEGQPEYGWVVVDLGDIIVHLFSPEQRDYYQLEELWQEGRVLLRLQ
ncbi:MAG TPA: ribosome silencing factor [Anaerolineaceae bacterium]|nr:ribosome silencing factor [Anaerolineaceae bacterium]